MRGGPFDEHENGSFGAYLGEYFAVVSDIGEHLAERDADELDDDEEYARLVDRREELKARLDAASEPEDDDIEAAFERAFAEE